MYTCFTLRKYLPRTLLRGWKLEQSFQKCKVVTFLIINIESYAGASWSAVFALVVTFSKGHRDPLLITMISGLVTSNLKRFNSQGSCYGIVLVSQLSKI